jgi:hypothetical protein
MQQHLVYIDHFQKMIDDLKQATTEAENMDKPNSNELGLSIFSGMQLALFYILFTMKTK